jgi:hypothetical protein
MKRITKTLSLKDWIADAVQELADREDRSFTRQVEALLEAALKRRESPKPAMQRTGD